MSDMKLYAVYLGGPALPGRIPGRGVLLSGAVDDASFQLGAACRRAVLDADMIIMGSS